MVSEVHITTHDKIAFYIIYLNSTMKFAWIWGKNLKCLVEKFNYSPDQLKQLDACFSSLQDCNQFIEWLRQQVRAVPEQLTGGFSIINLNGQTEWINRFRHAQEWANLMQLKESFSVSNIAKDVSSNCENNNVKVPIFDIRNSSQKKGSTKQTNEVEWLALTPLSSMEKMYYYNDILTRKALASGHGCVRRQKIKDSYQVQGDISSNWDQLKEAALECIRDKERQHKFTAILMDPPWKHTGHSFNYKTIENNLWMDKIKFKDIQDSGFVFMWVTNKYVDDAVQFMKTQEYKRIETISWIKTCKNGSLRRGMGRYLWHSQEQCLVFRRLAEGISDTDFSVLRAAENVIVSRPKGKYSMKPFQLYELIEAMIPGGKYLEIFGRPHNTRAGWVTMGDEAICFDMSYMNTHKSLKAVPKKIKSSRVSVASKQIKKKKQK